MKVKAASRWASNLSPGNGPAKYPIRPQYKACSILSKM